MSKSAARSRPAAAAQRAPAQAKKAPAQSQKRKRAAVESDDDDEGDDFDLDAMVDGGADDEEDDEEELDLDPQELAAMKHLYGKPKKQRKQEDSEDEEMDGEEDGESSEDDGEEAADEGTGQIARPAKKKQKITFLNNKAALLDKLADMRLPASYPWIETLQLTTKKSFLEATDSAADAVHDDLKREAAFYELSLNGASEGLQQLTDLSIPFRIPPDFFAERVKPDKHMARIKDKLIEEQRKMVAVSERKLDKETRKFAKTVQSAKLQEKSAEKKASLAAAGKMRKTDDGQELGVERSILPGVSAHLAANRADDAARREKKSMKREAKDKKYGHGGKKKNVRKNDAESAKSGKDYSVGAMRQNFGGFKDTKPGSFQERRSKSNKSSDSTTYNKNGSSFTPNGRGGRGGASGGRGGGFSSRGGSSGGRGGGSARGGRGGGRGGKPSRPGKSSRAQSRK